MKVGVVGSRGFDDMGLMRDILSTFRTTEIVSGGARGADSLAAEYAREAGIPFTCFPADWDLGKHAGHLRNQKIVDHSDVVVAFWDGISTGTKDTIRRTRKANKPLSIVLYNELKNQLSFEDQ